MYKIIGKNWNWQTCGHYSTIWAIFVYISLPHFNGFPSSQGCWPEVPGFNYNFDEYSVPKFLHSTFHFRHLSTPGSFLAANQTNWFLYIGCRVGLFGAVINLCRASVRGLHTCDLGRFLWLPDLITWVPPIVLCKCCNWQPVHRHLSR